MKIEKMTHTCQWVLVNSWDIKPGAHLFELAPDAPGLYRMWCRGALVKMFNDATWHEEQPSRTLYMKPGDVFRRILIAWTTAESGSVIVEKLDVPDDFGRHYDSFAVRGA